MSSVREAARALLEAFNSGQPYVRKLMALEQALEAGTVEVPMEPTPEMVTAGYWAACGYDWPDEWADSGITWEAYTAKAVYRAMLAAAREPEAREGEG